MFLSECDVYSRDRVAELSVILCTVLLVTGLVFSCGHGFGVPCERECCCEEDG
jgi:hypothetical protein